MLRNVTAACLHRRGELSKGDACTTYEVTRKEYDERKTTKEGGRSPTARPASGMHRAGQASYNCPYKTLTKALMHVN